MKYDELLVTSLGDFGRYQRIQFFLVLIPCIFVSMQALSWTFTGATLPYRCAYPGEESLSSDSINYSSLASQLGVDSKDSKARKVLECDRFSNVSMPSNLPVEAGSNGTINPDFPTEHCSAWVYDHSEISHSAINRWDVVCSRRWIRAMVQSMYYIGQAVGSLFFGYLGDRHGRKFAFIIAIIIQAISGSLMAVVPWVEAFAVLRMMVGFCHPGVFVISVVIGMELVGPSKRFIGGIMTGVFFAIGQVLLGGLAFGVRNYQHLQLIISLPYFVFIAYWWIVPESARWLISQGRREDADAILRRAARMNGRHLPEDWWERLDKDNGSGAGKAGPVKKYTYLDIFRYAVTRRRALIQFLCWPTVSMVYYGISMNPSFLGGNRYVTFILAAIAEVPGIVIAGLLINKVGRKILAIAGFALSGLALLATLLMSPYPTVLTLLVTIAKATITLTYAVEYTWSPELFPTVIRNQAMGLCSMTARVGGVAASYLIMYFAEYNKEAVVVVFATFALGAAALSLLQPETSGVPLLETIADAEAFAQGAKILSFRPPPLAPKSSHLLPETNGDGGALYEKDATELSDLKSSKDDEANGTLTEEIA